MLAQVVQNKCLHSTATSLATELPRPIHRLCFRRRSVESLGVQARRTMLYCFLTWVATSSNSRCGRFARIKGDANECHLLSLQLRAATAFTTFAQDVTSCQN